MTTAAPKRAVRAVLAGYRELRDKRLERSVAGVLSDERPPQPYDSEEVFRELQQRFPRRDGYKYDPFSLWQRGIERAQQLLSLSGSLQSPGKDVLEVGCGDGMVGKALQTFGHSVILCDFEDWRDTRVSEMPFLICDVSRDVPELNRQFDLIYSYNTFEHVLNPRAALENMSRLSKRDGLIYLEFGPLYASAWGLHAYRTLHMPYSQFLFSAEFIAKKLDELGIDDLGRKRLQLQPLNRLRLADFEQIWKSISGVELVSSRLLQDSSYLEFVEQYPDAFRGRNLACIDLTTYGIAVLLRRTSVAREP